MVWNRQELCVLHSQFFCRWDKAKILLKKKIYFRNMHFMSKKPNVIGIFNEALNCMCNDKLGCTYGNSLSFYTFGKVHYDSKTFQATLCS